MCCVAIVNTIGGDNGREEMKNNLKYVIRAISRNEMGCALGK